MTTTHKVKLIESVSALIAEAVENMKGVERPMFTYTAGKIIEMMKAEIRCMS